MFFVASGEVALTRGGKPLDVIKTGEVVGEMSVLTGVPRSATASAKTDISAGVYQPNIRKVRA